jgi:hypothetical protein
MTDARLAEATGLPLRTVGRYLKLEYGWGMIDRYWVGFRRRKAHGRALSRQLLGKLPARRARLGEAQVIKLDQSRAGRL